MAGAGQARGWWWWLLRWLLSASDGGCGVGMQGSQSFSCTTNNEAEYSGLILGLEKALELQLRSVRVEGDSKLVVEQVSGNWKINKEHLRVLQRRVLALRAQFDSFSIRHIPRARNALADSLATAAILNPQESERHRSDPEVAARPAARSTGKRKQVRAWQLAPTNATQRSYSNSLAAGHLHAPPRLSVALRALAKERTGEAVAVAA